MIKAYRYRIYPTKKQTHLLSQWLALCCEIYNAALQEHRDAYHMVGKSLSYSHQCTELPECKAVRPELAEVNSQVLQDALKRVDRAFENFFRRLKEGQPSGYPRFRSRFRYVCGLVIDRDHNASINILEAACGRAGRVIPEAPGLEPWGVVTTSFCLQTRPQHSSHEPLHSMEQERTHIDTIFAG